RTGVVQWVARQLERVIRQRYNRLVLVNTAIPGILSGFVNIVAAASFFIPVILRLCKQMKVPQAKLLLPMACTALIGANLSLIGASHNLVVHSLLEEAEGRGFAFFEFTVVGAVLLVAAIIYIFLLGDKLLPGMRETPDPTKVPVTADLAKTYALADRLFEGWVSSKLEEDCDTIKELNFDEFGLTLLAVVRNGDQLLFPTASFEPKEGDTFLIQGKKDVVEDFCLRRRGLTFIGAPKGQEAFPISTAELAEAVVPPRSDAIGKTVNELTFLQESGLTPLAYYRDNRPHRTGARDIELREGDSILFYGPRNRMREFDPEKELLVYFKPGKPEVSTKMKKKAPIAAAILAVVILVAALDWFPIAATAIGGATAMLLLGIVEPKRVYRAIDWRTLVLIGGMYPLGFALNQSGAADFVGNSLISLLGGLGPLAVLGGVVLLCMLLTQPIHNAAVAIIMTPIAINAAETLGSNPRAFCVAVVIACSATFLMPYGHPAPFLVQEPGNYRNSDYLRFGLGLNLIALVVILTVVPLFWSL
ncbi:MAG TPA: SLC13 family permease, partial [Opitutales bacterium]|nr:SLC13 family permease [Opitutales bacterium]